LVAEGSTLKRGLVGAGVCGVVALLAQPVASTACFGDECRGDSASFGEVPADNRATRVPGKGRYLDENTWETNPLYASEEVRLAADGGFVERANWLPFTRKRTLDIFTGDDRFPSDVEVYISVGERQGFEVNNGVPRMENFTLASGNLAKIIVFTTGRVAVVNDSCADFFLRAVVHFPPRIPGADAGADATSSDAGTTETGASDAGLRDAPQDSPATD
jgi:hypothetical protein